MGAITKNDFGASLISMESTEKKGPFKLLHCSQDIVCYILQFLPIVQCVTAIRVCKTLRLPGRLAAKLRLKALAAVIGFPPDSTEEEGPEFPWIEEFMWFRSFPPFREFFAPRKGILFTESQKRHPEREWLQRASVRFTGKPNFCLIPERASGLWCFTLAFVDTAMLKRRNWKKKRSQRLRPICGACDSGTPIVVSDFSNRPHSWLCWYSDAPAAEGVSIEELMWPWPLERWIGQVQGPDVSAMIDFFSERS